MDRSLQTLNYCAKWFKVRELTHRQKQILVGCFFLDWPTARIARAIDVSESTVRSQKSKLTKKLEENPGIMDTLAEEWPIGHWKEEFVTSLMAPLATV